MTQRNTTMTYEQLKQSHDEWKQIAKDNFSSYKHEKARADAAEKREQQLKEAIENALKWTWYHSEANMVEIDTVLNDILSTLYPDTPAPKEGE